MRGNVATGLEGWKVNDRVAHDKEPFRYGTIKVVEDNGLSVMVLWDDMLEDGSLDFQWSNRLFHAVEYKKVDSNTDKPHRCPECHGIPDEAYLDGTSIPCKTYRCEDCKVEWVM